MPIQAVLTGVAKVSKFLKANPWVGSAVKYGVERRDMNRAHRRQMSDLSRAGINPILSAKFGGAQTPSMEGIGQVSNENRGHDYKEELTDQQVKRLKEEVKGLASENVLKNLTAEFFESDEGKKAAETLAVGGKTESPTGKVMRYLFGRSGSENAVENVDSGISSTFNWFKKNGEIYRDFIESKLKQNYNSAKQWYEQNTNQPKPRSQQ